MKIEFHLEGRETHFYLSESTDFDVNDEGQIDRVFEAAKTVCKRGLKAAWGDK
jgi:hypothetical protein